METTEHARIRARQRGFRNFALDVIGRYGKQERVPGGAIRIILGRKERQEIVGELKRTIQLLDKAEGKMIVIEGQILTIYK